MYPAFGRQARSLRSTIWVRTRIPTLYLVLGTVLEFPLLHSSISVRYSILKRSEKQDARTEINAAPYYQGFTKGRI